jgi:AAA domain/Bifunctional DNA primase/polymerase, N-terminal
MSSDEMSKSDLLTAELPNLAAALRHASIGLRVLPVRVYQDEGKRWRKKPCIKGWQDKATNDFAVLEQWWEDFPAALPGIELASAGLFVVDTDRHEAGKDGVAAFAALRTANPNFPSQPKTLTAGLGEHFFFRQPPGMCVGNAEGGLPPGVNVRGAGGFVVAPGALRPDGAIWEPAPDTPDLVGAFQAGTIPPVPPWLVEVLSPQNGRSAKIAPSAARDITAREKAYASAALDAVCNEVAISNVGERNNAVNATAYRLGRMVGRGWLERHVVVSRLITASERNGLVLDDGEKSVKDTIESGLNAGIANPHGDLADSGGNKIATPASFTSSPPLIPVYWDGDVPIRKPNWLVRDLVPLKASGLLVGESRAGKTFLALDLARALSKGGFFLSKPARQGGTLYLAAEAPGTIPGRLKAARIGPLWPFSSDTDDNESNNQEPGLLSVVVAPNPPDLLAEQGRAQLVRTANDVSGQMQARFDAPLRLIVVDTMLAAFDIQDWNNPAETRRVMKALAQIAEETDAVVLGVHHHGKDVTRGAAGSYALTAAADFVLSAFAETSTDGMVTNRRLSVTKLRDAPTGWSCEFGLQPFKIGMDDEGEDIVSAFVEPKAVTAGFEKKVYNTKRKSLPQSVSILVDALEEVLEAKGADRTIAETGQAVRMVQRSDVMASFGLRYNSATSKVKSPDAQRQAFKRALQGAIERGAVKEYGQEWLRRDATNSGSSM